MPLRGNLQILCKGTSQDGNDWGLGANRLEFLLLGTAEPMCLRPDDCCKDWVWLCGTDDQRWEPR